MTQPAAFYTSQAAIHDKEIKRLKERYTLIAFLRLAAFVLTGIAIYRCIIDFSPVLAITAIVFLGLFILLVRIAFNIRDKKALEEKLLQVVNNELAVLKQENSFFENGNDFLEHNDIAADLDIFGNGSLYHVINRATTGLGKTALADMFNQPLLGKEKIQDYQDAVKQLAGQPAVRQQVTAHGLLNDENEGNLYDIESWLKLPNTLLDKKWVGLLRWVFPAFSLFAWWYYLETDQIGLLAIAVLCNWAVIGIFFKQINRQHVLIGKKQAILSQYADILTQFGKTDTAGSTLLAEKKQQALAASGSIKKLSSLAGFFDQRINLLVIIFLNSFIMYDIQVMWSLEKWKSDNKIRFNDWVDCTSTIEVLNSLATFAFNFPEFIYPEIITHELLLEGTGLAHPLISSNERVANDFQAGKKEKLILVTGSNMSGKTTFLRTLGVNLILAQCGAPVCARTFRCTPMTIRTSIRVSDSLQEHTSYFMAELKRLQGIIEHLRNSETPTLVLIDEILRGTNSEDKTFGSEQFIKKILQFNCLTLFATHDLMLSKLETELPGQVSNYCFESIIRENTLLFDYKLQEGVAKNKNASFLMKQMDII